MSTRNGRITLLCDSPHQMLGGRAAPHAEGCPDSLVTPYAYGEWEARKWAEEHHGWHMDGSTDYSPECWRAHEVWVALPIRGRRLEMGYKEADA